MLEKHARDQLCSLLRKSVNYDRKKFYNVGPRKDGVVRGLYAGTVPSLAANVAENSILVPMLINFLLRH
jgi:hypothetical protein